MKQKLKLSIAFLCGALFFSGISYAANTLTARIVDYKIIVNGQEKTLSEKPVLINNRVYLPVRDIGTITGYTVDYKNRVVTLSNTEKSTNSSGGVGSVSENQNGSSELPNFEFKKLPITITKGDVTVTVNSVSLGEFSTDFYVTIVNNTNKDLYVDYRGNVLGANYNVTGKQYKTFGTISGETEFSKPVPANSSVTGTIRKGKVDEGTENVIFHIVINSEELFNEGFSFYIDTKGLF